jgi:hypothetical protein
LYNSNLSAAMNTQLSKSDRTSLESAVAFPRVRFGVARLLQESWLWPGPLLSPSVASIWTLAASKTARQIIDGRRTLYDLRRFVMRMML